MSGIAYHITFYLLSADMKRCECQIYVVGGKEYKYYVRNDYVRGRHHRLIVVPHFRTVLYQMIPILRTVQRCCSAWIQYFSTSERLL